MSYCKRNSIIERMNFVRPICPIRRLIRDRDSRIMNLSIKRASVNDNNDNARHSMCTARQQREIQYRSIHRPSMRPKEMDRHRGKRIVLNRIRLRERSDSNEYENRLLDQRRSWFRVTKDRVLSTRTIYLCKTLHYKKKKKKCDDNNEYNFSLTT